MMLAVIFLTPLHLFTKNETAFKLFNIVAIAGHRKRIEIRSMLKLLLEKSRLAWADNEERWTIGTRSEK